MVQLCVVACQIILFFHYTSEFATDCSLEVMVEEYSTKLKVSESKSSVINVVK